MSADRLLSRRTFGSGTAALAVVLTTAGCDSGDGLDLPDLPGLPAEEQEEPDRPRVLDALRGEQAVLDQLRRVQRRHKSLDRALAATAAVHRDHVDLLSGAVEDAESGSPTGKGDKDPVPADPALAVAELVKLERTLSDEHVATAMRSRSGVLARVVAAMSAAAAQQAVVLSALATKEPAG